MGSRRVRDSQAGQARMATDRPLGGPSSFLGATDRATDAAGALGIHAAIVAGISLAPAPARSRPRILPCVARGAVPQRHCESPDRERARGGRRYGLLLARTAAQSLDGVHTSVRAIQESSGRAGNMLFARNRASLPGDRIGRKRLAVRGHGAIARPAASTICGTTRSIPIFLLTTFTSWRVAAGNLEGQATVSIGLTVANEIRSDRFVF